MVANNDLAEFLNDLKMVLSSLALTTKHVSEVQAMDQVRSRVESTAGELLPTLERIQQAQSIGDSIAIADEIQYELPGRMEEWQSLVEEAARLLDAEGAEA